MKNLENQGGKDATRAPLSISFQTQNTKLVRLPVLSLFRTKCGSATNANPRASPDAAPAREAVLRGGGGQDPDDTSGKTRSLPRRQGCWLCPLSRRSSAPRPAHRTAPDPRSAPLPAGARPLTGHPGPRQAPSGLGPPRRARARGRVRPAAPTAAPRQAGPHARPDRLLRPGLRLRGSPATHAHRPAHPATHPRALAGACRGRGGGAARAEKVDPCVAGGRLEKAAWTSPAQTGNAAADEPRRALRVNPLLPAPGSSPSAPPLLPPLRLHLKEASSTQSWVTQ